MRFHCPQSATIRMVSHMILFLFIAMKDYHDYEQNRPPQQIIYKHNCSKHLTQKEIAEERGRERELTQRHRGQFSQWKANEMSWGFSSFFLFVWIVLHILPAVSFMHSLTKQIFYSIDLTISLTLAEPPRWDSGNILEKKKCRLQFSSFISYNWHLFL